MEPLLHLKGVTDGLDSTAVRGGKEWFGSIPLTKLFIIRLIAVFAFGSDHPS